LKGKERYRWEENRDKGGRIRKEGKGIEGKRGVKGSTSAIKAWERKKRKGGREGPKGYRKGQRRNRRCRYMGGARKGRRG
jgi:hypothetical protein